MSEKLKKFVSQRHPSCLKEQLARVNVTHDRSIYWLHISSAGEMEQIKPIINRMIKKNRTVFFVTYFSPDAEQFVANVEGVVGYCALPLDIRSIHEHIIDTLKIKHVLFVRYDLWPGMIAVCKRNKVPYSVVCATTRTTRAGFSRTLSLFYRGWAVNGARFAFVVEQEDLGFFKKYARHVVHVGDPKWSRARDRAEAFKGSAPNPLLKLITSITQRNKSDRKVFVFGSPHIQESECLEMHFNALCFIAPHSMSEVKDVCRRLEAAGQKYAVLSQLHSSGSESTNGISNLDYVVVDAVGCLAEMYALADVSVVGGGFDGKLHNVLESAAHGTPTVFGSQIFRAPEAAQLIEKNAAISFDSTQDLFQFLNDCASFKVECEVTLAKVRLSATELFQKLPDTSEIVCRHLLQD